MNSEVTGSNSTGGSAPVFFTGFEGGLKAVRLRLEEGDLEGAHEALLALEERYVCGAVLFDLLGDVLLARGEVERGVRYKTLYQILNGTFRIVAEEAARDVRGPARERVEGPAVSIPQEPGTAPPAPQGPEDEGIGDYVPVTAAMAEEFMRQGHYEQAERILAQLAAKSPEDEALRQGQEAAHQRAKDKRLLLVFKRWLTNIERMKWGEPTI
ncbi:MAG: hypothetical protein FJY85_15120 [Deltaproteobacteria bacterium]|nr:hypothetical protein [Deltaproteobacteria bacterium]